MQRHVKDFPKVKLKTFCDTASFIHVTGIRWTPVGQTVEVGLNVGLEISILSTWPSDSLIVFLL